MHPFAPGQVWTYKTRPAEDASRVIVCRVESMPGLGEVVHIYVNGLQMKSRHSPGGICHTIAHLPYDSEALRLYLLSLESMDAPVPPFEKGYLEWQSARKSEGAGVFTAPISVIIDGAEGASNR